MTTTRTVSLDELEARLNCFGRVALLKTAAALVTENRGTPYLFAITIDALAVDDDAADDLMADALDTLASVASAEAATLRGTTTKETT